MTPIIRVYYLFYKGLFVVVGSFVFDGLQLLICADGRSYDYSGLLVSIMEFKNDLRAGNLSFK